MNISNFIVWLCEAIKSLPFTFHQFVLCLIIAFLFMYTRWRSISSLKCLSWRVLLPNWRRRRTEKCRNSGEGTRQQLPFQGLHSLVIIIKCMFPDMHMYSFSVCLFLKVYLPAVYNWEAAQLSSRGCDVYVMCPLNRQNITQCTTSSIQLWPTERGQESADMCMFQRSSCLSNHPFSTDRS